MCASGSAMALQQSASHARIGAGFVLASWPVSRPTAAIDAAIRSIVPATADRTSSTGEPGSSASIGFSASQRRALASAHSPAASALTAVARRFRVFVSIVVFGGPRLRTCL